MTDFEILNEKWSEVLEKIREDLELTNVSYSSWLEPLELYKIENDTVTIIVPSGSLGINVLNKKYKMALKVAITEVTGLSLDINFASPDSVDSVVSSEDNMEYLFKSANLDSKYTFESFVVGNNNKIAYSAALAVAEAPGEIYNPLYLYSNVGLGKTHLMNSIAHFILDNNPDTKILYVTGEIFTNELIDAIRKGTTSAFKEKYRNLDVLLIDDIQFIVGKESTQEEFFHTFNTLHGLKKQIIISSDRPPRSLEILEERIRSRLESGLIVDISAPDYETRMAIISKKAEQKGMDLDDSVKDYIATNIKSNIREIEGCLTTINAKSMFLKRKIDVEFAEEVLKYYIIPKEEKAITSEKIIEVVSDHFNITVDEIKSPKRNAAYVYPRKIAMYLCRTMTPDSLQAIATLLNRKDHTTVISAYNNIEEEINVKEETRRHIDVIKNKLNSKI